MSEQKTAPAPEAPKERTMQDVQNDYQNFLNRAGQNQYQIHCLKNDLDLINGKLKDLNLEYVALQNKAAEAAKVRAEIEAKVKAETTQPDKAAVAIETKPEEAPKAPEPAKRKPKAKKEELPHA